MANDYQNYSGGMVGRMITFKDVHMIISRTCYLTWQRDFVIKVKNLRLRDYPGLSGRLNLFT